MDTDALAELHERLGDAYLDAMKAHGVCFPPVVGWMTHPPSMSGRTIACILWDEGDEEVAGFPRDLIASVVARRVLAGLRERGTLGTWGGN